MQMWRAELACGAHLVGRYVVRGLSLYSWQMETVSYRLDDLVIPHRETAELIRRRPGASGVHGIYMTMSADYVLRANGIELTNIEAAQISDGADALETLLPRGIVAVPVDMRELI